jgi:transposase
VRVYLCLKPCDMCKSFDGLRALVREHLQLDAFAGHLYLFFSWRKDRLKVLYWNRDGFARYEIIVGHVVLHEPDGKRAAKAGAAG